MSNKPMPVFFIGHGSPMNAIEDNEFSQTWQALGRSIPEPKAILCISAHWETAQPGVTVNEKPETIHDFYGFPEELNSMEYPAPGSPELAKRVMELCADSAVSGETDWGLDHGTWSVLARMYPKANIPVVQLSLAHTRDGHFHYDLGKHLAPLREEGILILGSGNVVHNLGRLQYGGGAFDWALEFDGKVKEHIESRNFEPLIDYQKQGTAAELSINSAEHYLPLLYILSLHRPEDDLKFYCEKAVYGSLSMRCIRFG